MTESEKTRRTLKAMRVRPVRERGQNFLVDSFALQSIVDFGNPRAGEQIIEIGPGLGAMTEQLRRFGKLAVVEVEEKFCEALRAKFPDVAVRQGDVREVDLAEFGDNLTVFGNLPYSLSTDIVFHVLGFHKVVRRAVFLLQKEFVQRMAASPGGKTYGVLSISCQLRADISCGPVISGDCFHPPTEVASQVVALNVLPGPRFPIKSEERFLRVVKGAFRERRKKILNSLRGAGLGSEDEVKAALQLAGIDSNQRAETVGVENYTVLANALTA